MKVSEAQNAGLGVRTVELVELARASLGDMSQGERTMGLRSLETRLAARRRNHARMRWSALAAGAVACGAALGAVAVWHHGQGRTPISFRIEGAEFRPGGAIEAIPSARPMVRFSDGSELSLTEGARVHVRSVDEHGARVTLDEGKAHVYVVHAPGAKWSFDAGPFVVGVTGTAFALSWVPMDHLLDLRLENGSVTVGGPLSDAPIALRAGQWLTVRGSDIRIRSLDPSELASSDQPTEPSAAPDPLTPTADNRRERASKPSQSPGPADGARHTRRATASGPIEHHWAADLAGGKVASIVEEALVLGLDNALAESSSDELSALADAARYTRHEDIAREALFTLRNRFPQTLHARDAAFLLGRLAETQQDSPGALSWFETYLRETPNGTYASEALGRKMTVVQRLEGNQAARPVAEDYMRRFPDGTYARAAEALRLAQ